MRVTNEDAARLRALAVTVELAFLGNSLEGFARALDPVLIIFTLRWQQFDDLIGPIGGHLTDRSRGEVDRLPNAELVLFQR